MHVCVCIYREIRGKEEEEDRVFKNVEVHYVRDYCSYRRIISLVEVHADDEEQMDDDDDDDQ